MLTPCITHLMWINLEMAAMRWLWLEQNCMVVIEERTPTYGMGQPDVLGITRGRHMTEIEVKRTVSDFKADAGKSHRLNREFAERDQTSGLAVFPRQFYYLVPPSIVERVKPMLPSWAGLMTVDDCCHVVVLTTAPVNKMSRKLSVMACARLARLMTNHVMAYKIANHSIQNNWRHRDDLSFVDWVDSKNGTYVI